SPTTKNTEYTSFHTLIFKQKTRRRILIPAAFLLKKATTIYCGDIKYKFELARHEKKWHKKWHKLTDKTP
ncbi:MAG: hypothetical protein IKD72_11250, partial [Clostridia bacterium]|nr:hypothetical protein [Clostridia bacterium]